MWPGNIPSAAGLVPYLCYFPWILKPACGYSSHPFPPSAKDDREALLEDVLSRGLTGGAPERNRKECSVIQREMPSNRAGPSEIEAS